MLCSNLLDGQTEREDKSILLAISGDIYLRVSPTLSRKTLKQLKTKSGISSGKSAENRRTNVSFDMSLNRSFE